MQNPGDCDCLHWANLKMCNNERRVVNRLKEKEEGMRAEVARVEKMDTVITKCKTNMESQST